MAGCLRFVARLPEGERQLIVDVPQEGVVARHCPGKRQRPSQCLDRLGRPVQGEVAAAEVNEGHGRRWYRGPGNLEIRERFGGASRLDECHAEAQVRHDVLRRRLQLRLELTNGFVVPEASFGEDRCRSQVIVGTTCFGVRLQGTAQEDARAIELRGVAIRASEQHVRLWTGIRLDHLGEQPLGLVELFDLQVGGAEEEGELRILRVGRTRRLERLHCFLQLPVGHERLCEQALQRPVLLVTAGDAGEDVDCVRRPTALQVHDGARLQCGVGVDDRARGAIECVPRVVHPRCGHVKLTEHHPRVEDCRSIQAFGLLQLPLAQARFGRGNGPIELDERVRRWLRYGAPISALRTPHALLRLSMRGRRHHDHRHHGHTK